MLLPALTAWLARLEKASSFQWAGLHEETQKRALEATSDGDLHLLHDWVARRASFSQATPEQQAALERYQTAYYAAERNIGGRDGRGRCDRNS